MRKSIRLAVFFINKLPRYKNFILQLLPFWVIMFFSSHLKAQGMPMDIGPSKFIGAELAATVIEPGKLKITLQTFYNDSEAVVPDIESVSVLESMVMTAGKPVELKKEKETVYNKYAPVGSTQITMPSVKTVLYSGVIDLGLFRTSYDITWAYAGLIQTFHNIELKREDALALIVHVGDPVTSIKNSIPVLDHLPAPLVNSNAKTSYPVDVTDKDETDKVEILLSTPLIFSAQSQTFHQQGSIITGRNPLKKVNYRKGFSEEMPGAKSFSYNKEKKEFSFDRPPFGKYLFAISISDYRNQSLMGQHQAVFIIESIF